MARPKYDEATLAKIKVIQNNLKRLSKENNMNQTEISKKTGISTSTISDYFRGETLINPGNMYLIAEALGVTTEDIYFENVQPSNLIHVTTNLVKIPIIGTIACGDPITAEQNIEGYMYESLDDLPSGTVYGLIAKGDSMEPTIPNGSKVIIREQSEVEYGEIAAVLVNGDTEATLKRVKKQGNVILLMPDNPKYEPYIITETNPARIIGKAISYKKSL